MTPVATLNLRSSFYCFFVLNQAVVTLLMFIASREGKLNTVGRFSNALKFHY